MSHLGHSYLFSSRPLQRRLFRMDDAELERYIAQVAKEEAEKTAALKALDASRKVEIRPEMTASELEAFKAGGFDDLAAHQVVRKSRKPFLSREQLRNVSEAASHLTGQELHSAPSPEDLIGTNPEEATFFQNAAERQRRTAQGEVVDDIEIEPADEEPDLEQAQREEAERHAEIDRLLGEIHEMLTPEPAAAANIEATREEVTIDGKIFRQGQEVVYTDRKGNQVIMTVDIPQGLAKGSLALSGQKENARGKMQRLNFAIDREAVNTRIDTDVEGFLQRQQMRKLSEQPTAPEQDEETLAA